MLFKLLTAPVTLPMSGMKFVLQQIADLAEQELDNESSLRDQLLLLQVQLEDGDVDEAEFAEREADLLARMRAIKERRGQDVPEADAEVNLRRRVVESHLDE